MTKLEPGFQFLQEGRWEYITRLKDLCFTALLSSFRSLDSVFIRLEQRRLIVHVRLLGWTILVLVSEDKKYATYCCELHLKSHFLKLKQVKAGLLLSFSCHFSEVFLKGMIHDVREFRLRSRSGFFSPPVKSCPGQDNYLITSPGIEYVLTLYFNHKFIIPKSKDAMTFFAISTAKY